MDFDDIRKHAEAHLGKERTARVERAVKNEVERQSKGPNSIVSTGDVQFVSELKDALNSVESPPSPAQNQRGDSRAKVAKRKSGSLKEAQPAPAATPPSVEMTPTANVSYSAEILKAAVDHEYRYARYGVLLGFSCIFAGALLCLNGVVGSTSWTARILGAESQINDAGPGVVVFVVGLFMVWVTRPRVRLGKLSG